MGVFHEQIHPVSCPGLCRHPVRLRCFRIFHCIQRIPGTHGHRIPGTHGRTYAGTHRCTACRTGFFLRF